MAAQYGFCPGDLLISGPRPLLPEAERTLGVTCRSPQSCPASVWKHQCKVPKYWWLRLIEREPPNQARLAKWGEGLGTALDAQTTWDRWWEPLMYEMQLAEAEGAKGQAAAR
jgi:hypothetical protein